MQFQHACALAEIEEGAARRIVLGGHAIAVFRSNGGLFAIDDTCSHDRASLADGYIEGRTVECPLHQALFCLESGRRLAGPACADVQAYAVRSNGGAVEIALPGENADA